MKTSVNIPNWLHAEAVALNPDAPFGVLVRDALLIALPEWRRSGKAAPIERALAMQLRLARSESARAAEQQAQASRAAGVAKRQSKAAKRAPDALPAHHRATGRRSGTTASVAVDQPGRKRK